MLPIKILVCDDHQPIRECIKLILKDSGYALYFALDGQEAIKKVKHLKPKVVLLDIKMPHLSGLDAIEQIKSVSPDSKIIMISGYEQPEVIKEALSRGAADYLAKSFSGEELKHSIQAALTKKS